MPDPDVAARDGILETNQRFIASFAAQDAADLVALYTDDAQLFPPHSAIIDGADHITAFWQSGFDKGLAGAHLETLEVDNVMVGESQAVTGVDIALAPNGSISGTVTPDTSMATLFAIIGVDTLSTATADTAGAYTLVGLLPRSYTVAASATGFQPAQVDSVAVMASEAVVGVDFTLSP